MAGDKSETRKLLLMALLALWLAAFGYSIIFALTTEPTGDSFTRGMNRITGFLGWQGVAAILAFGSWGVGRSFERGSGIRRVSVVPLAMAGALMLVGIAMVVLRG